MNIEEAKNAVRNYELIFIEQCLGRRIIEELALVVENTGNCSQADMEYIFQFNKPDTVYRYDIYVDKPEDRLIVKTREFGYTTGYVGRKGITLKICEVTPLLETKLYNHVKFRAENRVDKDFQRNGGTLIQEKSKFLMEKAEAWELRGILQK